MGVKKCLSIKTSSVLFQRDGEQRQHRSGVEGEEVKDFRTRQQVCLQELLRLQPTREGNQAASGEASQSPPSFNSTNH